MPIDESLYRPGCPTPKPPVGRWRIKTVSPPRRPPHVEKVNETDECSSPIRQCRGPMVDYPAMYSSRKKLDDHCAKSLAQSLSQREKESPVVEQQQGVVPQALPTATGPPSINVYVPVPIHEELLGHHRDELVPVHPLVTQEQKGKVTPSHKTKEKVPQADHVNSTERMIPAVLRTRAFEPYDYGKFSRSSADAYTGSDSLRDRINALGLHVAGADTFVYDDNGSAGDTAGTPRTPRTTAGSTVRTPGEKDEVSTAVSRVSPTAAPKRPSPSKAVVDRHIYKLAANHQRDRRPQTARARGTAREEQRAATALRKHHVEADLYAAEVRRVRKHQKQEEGLKPYFHREGLAVKTFDLPPEPGHRQLTEDIAQDQMLVKLKHNAEEDMKQKALVKARREVFRRTVLERSKAKFERSVALGEPHALGKTRRVIAEEWMNQMEAKAKADGYALGPTARAQHFYLSHVEGAQVTKKMREHLREQQGGFGPTPHERDARFRLQFLEQYQHGGKPALPKRPQPPSLMNEESRKLVTASARQRPLKPGPPQLACEWGEGEEAANTEKLAREKREGKGRGVQEAEEGGFYGRFAAHLQQRVHQGGGPADETPAALVKSLPVGDERLDWSSDDE